MEWFSGMLKMRGHLWSEALQSVKGSFSNLCFLTLTSMPEDCIVLHRDKEKKV